MREMNSKPNTTVYLGNLPFSTTEAQIRDLLGAGREIAWVKIILDKNTKKPMGFAFVEFLSPEAAIEVVKTFDKTQFGGRTLKVALARPREQQQQRSATK